MTMSLLPSERAQYAAIIDGILSASNLTTITAKQIRRGLQEKLDHDISEKKALIQDLIMERFDKAEASAEAPAPVSAPVVVTTNGHHKKEKSSYKAPTAEPTPTASASASASTSEGKPEYTPEDSASEVDASPPPKKKRKTPSAKSTAPLDDAALAAMLQAEENTRARPTRGGANKKTVIKKRSTPKKKSAAKLKSGDDSELDIDSDGEVREKVRKGGFHKQYALSTPLADLVGESAVVKKIWEYIKERDLQDPSDKRQIRCDSKMQLVFKQDKVHMFTMNKILSKQLYDLEE